MIKHALHGNGAAVGLVARRAFGLNSAFHDSTPRFDQTTDPVGEIVGQDVGVKLIHHDEHAKSWVFGVHRPSDEIMPA